MRVISRLSLAVFLTPLVTLSLLWLVTVNVFAASKMVGAPDVILLISMHGDGMTSIGYSKAISKEESQKGLTQLVKETEWQIQNINISNDSGTIPGETTVPTTTVDFTRVGPSAYEDISLPIEPIINTFKKYSHIKIIYMVSPSFRFDGVSNYENRYVGVNLSASTGSYQYDISIKDHGFERISLPRHLVQKQSETKPVAGSSRSMSPLLVISLAIVTAVCVFFIVKSVTGKREIHTSRRS